MMLSIWRSIKTPRGHGICKYTRHDYACVLCCRSKGEAVLAARIFKWTRGQFRPWSRTGAGKHLSWKSPTPQHTFIMSSTSWSSAVTIVGSFCFVPPHPLLDIFYDSNWESILLLLRHLLNWNLISCVPVQRWVLLIPLTPTCCSECLPTRRHARVGRYNDAGVCRLHHPGRLPNRTEGQEIPAWQGEDLTHFDGSWIRQLVFRLWTEADNSGEQFSWFENL